MRFANQFEGKDVPICKSFIGKVRSINEKDFTAEVVFSDETLDRYYEVIEAQAWKKRLPTYKEHPVLLSSHTYGDLRKQIGEVPKIWIDQEEKALVGLAKYYVGEGNQEADWAWNLVKHGRAAYSVGFRAYEVEEVDYDEWSKNKKKPRRTYKDVELMENSHVIIPANPSALQKGLASEDPATLFVARGFLEDEELKSAIKPEKSEQQEKEEEDMKGVIGYSKMPMCDMGMAWDAGKEVKAATVDDLKKMCAWYANDGANKGDYKLPHHIKAGYKTNWNGVRAAMGALFGARGGVQIPAGDKAGVHTHLSGHYKDFGKTPPALKDYIAVVYDTAKDLLMLTAEDGSTYVDLAGDITVYDGEGTSSLAYDEVWTNEKVQAYTEKLVETIVARFSALLDQRFAEPITVIVEGLAPKEEQAGKTGAAETDETKDWDEKPNEIRCRILDPALFDKFRRFLMKKDKPRVFGLYGKYKGKEQWAIQALRFPKGDGWTLEKAKEWYKANPIKADYVPEAKDFIDAFDLDAASIDLLELEPDGEGYVGMVLDGTAPGAAKDLEKVLAALETGTSILKNLPSAPAK